MSKADKFCALRQQVVGLMWKRALYKGTTMKFDNCNVQNDSEDHYNYLIRSIKQIMPCLEVWNL